MFWCTLKKKKKKESNGEVFRSLELVDPDLVFHLASSRCKYLLTSWVLNADLDLHCFLAYFLPHGFVLLSKRYSRTCDGPFLVFLGLASHKNGNLDTPILPCMNYWYFYDVMKLEFWFGLH